MKYLSLYTTPCGNDLDFTLTAESAWSKIKPISECTLVQTRVRVTIHHGTAY
jgi:hypothetical protein